MKLNKTFALAALVAGSLFAGGALQAQESTNTPAAGMRPRGLNFAAITKQLDLTPEETPKFKAVYDDLMQKQRDLRSDASLEPAEKRAKAKELRDAATAKLKDILTPEQLAKWEKMGPPQRKRPAATPVTNAVPATAAP